jgi:hypothetical protein
MNQESRKAGENLRDSKLTQEIIACAIQVHRAHQIGEHRLDFLVEGKIVVELKAISRLEDIHFAIGRSYLKAANLNDGLLFNFATAPLTIKRFCRELPNEHEPVDLLA